MDAIVERALGELAKSGQSSYAELARFLLDRVRRSSTGFNVSQHAEHWGCDTSKAADELGFQTLRSLDEAASEIIRSYLQDGSVAAAHNAASGSEV